MFVCVLEVFFVFWTRVCLLWSSVIDFERSIHLCVCGLREVHRRVEKDSKRGGNQRKWVSG